MAFILVVNDDKYEYDCIWYVIVRNACMHMSTANQKSCSDILLKTCFTGKTFTNRRVV